MTLATIANRTIAPAKITDALLHVDFNTGDIMRTVLKVYDKYYSDLKDFAPQLKGDSLYDTCSNIWHFVKDNIRYVKDPAENQWVKSPKRLWSDKQGDCKSYAVFIASCLRCLHIPHIIRFVSFDSFNSHPTHVYVVVMDGNKEIILDCVVNAFDKEAPYTFKHDYMKGLYVMNGLPDVSGGAGTILYGSKRKDALKAALPVLAINFIYNFIPHAAFWCTSGLDFYSRLPQGIRDKETKAWTVANDWSDWAGWEEHDLMNTLRSTISGILGMDVEEWWHARLKGFYGITGIGDDGSAATTTTTTTNTSSSQNYSWVKGLISSVFNSSSSGIQFKVPLDQFTPEESDWTGITQQVLNPVWAVKQLANVSFGVNPVATTTTQQQPQSTGNSTPPYVFSQPPATTQQTPPIYQPPAIQKVFDPATGLYKDSLGNYYNIDGTKVDPATGKPVTSPGSITDLGFGSSNILMYGLIGVAAWMLFKKK